METFFLACFFIGLLFTLASLALGQFGAHVPHLGHHVDLAHPSHNGSASESHALPLLNGSSAVGGLTWFGAAGYLLVRVGDWSLPAAVLGGLAAGAVGWYLIARFLALILRGEVEMNPEDYRLEGTVGQVSVGIPLGGTGEILFEKGGARRSEAARALGDAAIARGTEVVITRYAKGFATVQPWSEFMEERESRSRLAAPTEASANNAGAQGEV